MRQRSLVDARRVFDGLLPADMVQSDGQVLLGTPLGVDSADVHVGSVRYRVRKLWDMIDAHDDRLRSVCPPIVTNSSWPAQSSTSSQAVLVRPRTQQTPCI
eukprot:COSAG02_NODE_210_length_28878_cov_133.787136_24_plen_101_part_00